MSLLKRLVVGEPIATSEEHHQRLGRPTALAVFASDAISSTAYATEEILLVLVPVAGLAALSDLIPLSIIVMVLLAIVITSYRQTIYAYPSGGGSYVVSRENLGENPSLVAGASLLVDYVLTVAVSVSAGVAAITSAFPSSRSRTPPHSRHRELHLERPADEVEPELERQLVASGRMFLDRPGPHDARRLDHHDPLHRQSVSSTLVGAIWATCDEHGGIRLWSVRCSGRSAARFS